MKIRMTVAMIAIIILCFGNASAALFDRGIDSLGNKLIYDTDLDVTWYDFTYETWDNIGATWSEGTIWAEDLIIIFNGTIFDEWRLPSSGDAPKRDYVQTESELGYLFYNALSNPGFRDENGNIQNPYGLINTGPFENLVADHYWSSTQTGTNSAWYFDLDDGYQSYGNMANHERVIALMAGDVTAVPIPGAAWLLGSGLIGTVFLRRRS